MAKWFMSPPVVFIVMLAVVLLLERFLARLSFRTQKPKPGSGESYACGESNYNSQAQPDYSQFFPFAFFFTLAHVATLIITTVFWLDAGSLVMAGVYIAGGITGLYILLRD